MEKSLLSPLWLPSHGAKSAGVLNLWSRSTALPTNPTTSRASCSEIAESLRVIRSTPILLQVESTTNTQHLTRLADPVSCMSIARDAQNNFEESRGLLLR